MASVMAISFVLNSPSMGPPPRPILKPLGYMNRNLPPLEECIVHANASHLHSTEPTAGDPFTSLNASLDGSKLVQMMHKRSPHGPDFGYENRDYPGMDGLLYRMFNPEPSSTSDSHFEAQQQYVEGANFSERREHMSNEPMVDQESRPPPENYQNDGQHPASNMMAIPDSSPITSKFHQNGGKNWQPIVNMMTLPENGLDTNQFFQNDGFYWNLVDVTAIPDNLPVPDNNKSQNISQLWGFIDFRTVPDRIQTPIESVQSEDSTLSPVYDFLGHIASTFGVTYAAELLLSPKQLLPIIEESNSNPDQISPRTPTSRHTDQTPTAPRSNKHLEPEQRANSFSESESSPAPEKEQQQITPPGYTMDYFTKKPRKMRMTDSRAQLRKQFDGFVEKPIEIRPQGVYWEEGDSEMEFSEWEEANRAVERVKRREKQERRERKLKLRRGSREVGLRG